MIDCYPQNPPPKPDVPWLVDSAYGYWQWHTWNTGAGWTGYWCWHPTVMKCWTPAQIGAGKTGAY